MTIVFSSFSVYRFKNGCKITVFLSHLQRKSLISSKIASGGIPQTPFFHQGVALCSFHLTPSSSARFHKAKRLKGPLPKALFHQHLQPLLVLKKRLRTFSQTLFQSLEQGLIDYGQRPPFVKGFLYGSQSLCPFGASHGLLHPCFRRPLKRGSMGGGNKRHKSPIRKGAQWEEATNATKAPYEKEPNGRRQQTPQKPHTKRSPMGRLR